MMPKDIITVAIVIFMVVAAIALDIVCIHWCVELFKDGEWPMGILSIGLLILWHGVVALKLLWGE